MEASGAMIELARARLSAGARQQVEFHHQDIRTAALGPKPYDVAVTLFFLDCFTETEACTIIKKIERSIQPGGFWIMGEFRQPQRGLAAVHARFWLWSMYSFFRFATGLRTFELPPYERQLSEAGLQLVEQRHWSAGMITAQLWKKTLRSEIHSLPSLIPGSPRQPAQCL
jgi:ubiquinone/menaquinone biosynthesis C-methylase UbiE